MNIEHSFGQLNFFCILNSLVKNCKKKSVRKVRIDWPTGAQGTSASETPFQQIYHVAKSFLLKRLMSSQKTFYKIDLSAVLRSRHKWI